jgi:hypothetical protein
MPAPAQFPVLPGINWEALLSIAGVIAAGLLVAKAFASPTSAHRCSICDRVGHDARTCSQDPAKRARLRIVKTRWCSCCKRRYRRTEAHHYAGPANGNKGREMCGTCHLVCGHAGDYRNMAVNPRYCRL